MWNPKDSCAKSWFSSSILLGSGENFRCSRFEVSGWMLLKGDCGILASFWFFPSCPSHDVSNFCSVMFPNKMYCWIMGPKSTKSNDHRVKPPKLGDQRNPPPCPLLLLPPFFSPSSSSSLLLLNNKTFIDFSHRPITTQIASKKYTASKDCGLTL